MIGSNNKQLGIFSLSEAEKIAEKEGLDLILVNSKQRPIVVKLGDYGAYVYQKEKKERKARKDQKETKEIRISFREAEYDLKRKAGLIKKFLDEGNQVQIRLILKGRERNFSDLAEEKLNSFLKIIEEMKSFKVVTPIDKTLNFLIVVIAAKN